MTSSESPAIRRLEPGVRVLVEVDGLAKGRVLLGHLEERALDRRGCPVATAHCLDNGLRVDPLVDVQGDRRDLERGVLGLAGPGQRGVEVRIVGIAMPGSVPISGFGDQPDGRIVLPLLALVVVLLDAAPAGRWLVRCLAWPRHRASRAGRPSLTLRHTLSDRGQGRRLLHQRSSVEDGKHVIDRGGSGPAAFSP
jgi:hypothetical protein